MAFLKNIKNSDHIGKAIKSIYMFQNIRMKLFLGFKILCF